MALAVPFTAFNKMSERSRACRAGVIDHWLVELVAHVELRLGLLTAAAYLMAATAVILFILKLIGLFA